MKGKGRCEHLKCLKRPAKRPLKSQEGEGFEKKEEGSKRCQNDLGK